jgi:glyoxylase-like metal-dependent hydrolase (beta-lactamase superfamily II)
MLKRALALAVMATALAIGPVHGAPPPKTAVALDLWRLDCGRFLINNFNARATWDMPSNCYLIRHGDTYMLWDAGLPAELIGHPEATPEQTVSLERTIVAQLAGLRIGPERISILGISHYHGDHIGQAASFPTAKMMIGKADMAAIRGGRDPERLKPWIEDGAPLVEVTGDHDVFGDGSVVMLATPGHTLGHSSLLVRLASGPILLSGDLYHFRGQVAKDEVSGNAVDPVQARTSMARMKQLLIKEGARLVIQHDLEDTDLVPALPGAAS